MSPADSGLCRRRAALPKTSPERRQHLPPRSTQFVIHEFEYQRIVIALSRYAWIVARRSNVIDDAVALVPLRIACVGTGSLTIVDKHIHLAL